MRELLGAMVRKTFTPSLVCGVAGLVACDGQSATPTTSATGLPSTAAAPEEPPPCDVEALTFSAPDAGSIRIRNEAAVRCEVDVFESELGDPLMEPNVWLDAGAEAEVLVEDAGASCDAPAGVTSIELTVNDRPVDVAISIPPTCGVLLTAIYQVEPAD